MKTCNYRVYRDNLGDCSNHGLSSYVDSGLLFFDCSKESAIEYCQQNGLNPNYQFYLKKRILWNEDHSVAVPWLMQKTALLCLVVISFILQMVQVTILMENAL